MRNPDGSLVHPPKLPKVKKPVLLTAGMQPPQQKVGRCDTIPDTEVCHLQMSFYTCSPDLQHQTRLVNRPKAVTEDRS